MHYERSDGRGKPGRRSKPRAGAGGETVEARGGGKEKDGSGAKSHVLAPLLLEIVTEEVHQKPKTPCLC